MRIYPIVEGHGEVEAAPVLMRRLLALAECFDVQVGTAIRRKQAEFRGERDVQNAVRLALLQPECAAVLILFDGDEGCSVELAERVRGWARAAAGDTPCEVVVAVREYETWFLAALESLRGQRGIQSDATAPASPESRRDAKGWLEEWMPKHVGYSETLDQPALSARFDLELAFRRNRSFRKLVTSIGWMLEEIGCARVALPPAAWSTAKPGRT